MSCTRQSSMSCKRQPFPQILLEGFLLHKQGSFLCKYHLSLEVLSFSFTSCVKKTPWPSTRLTNFELQSCYPINMHSCVLQDVSWRFNLFPSHLVSKGHLWSRIRINLDYQPGQQVLKLVASPDKLAPHYTGPYSLASVHTNGTVCLQLTPVIQEWINIHRIWPLHAVIGEVLS